MIIQFIYTVNNEQIGAIRISISFNYLSLGGLGSLNSFPLAPYKTHNRL